MVCSLSQVQFFGGKFRLSPPSVAGGGLGPGVVASFRIRLRTWAAVAIRCSSGNRDEFGASIVPDYAPACSTYLLLTAALWPPSLSSLFASSLRLRSTASASGHRIASPLGEGRAFRVGDCLCLRARMVVDAPFVRWDIIRHNSAGSTRAGVYYLETAQGDRVVCAVAIPCEGNRMTYRPYDSFLEDYLLPSACVLECNFRFQLAKWLDGIVYYSFLQYSEEGIGSCWHFACVGPADIAQRLPLGLRRYFLASASAAWILVLHGYRIWPVQIVDQRFGDGWNEFRAAHQLKPGFKVIFACERKWIFHTVILDENDREVRFHWSGPNVHRRQLHPPRALRTSCLPSCISSEGTVLQFGHLHLPIVQLRLDFEVRLKEAFQEFDLEEMVLKMGRRVWNVPINDLRLDADAFDQFLDALDLSYLDFLLVLMLPTLEFQVVVFPMDYDVDRIYSWC
ncbi:hypothetical protein RHMOL_Rhmol10G0082700 [Rhododendron molle]|uniref:Uncharacterized protein n=1 Tax=Rhododendron molle TaxID=49168 RepID=A0ACC0M0B7_RHOML|nr:hypothetical protein RHMOL_Rhmol10G0082700 [Rhododendron molle]